MTGPELLAWAAWIVGPGGIVVGAVALYKARAERRAIATAAIKTEAEAELLTEQLRHAVLSDARDLIDSLRSRVDVLDGRVTELSRELTSAVDRARRAEIHADYVHEWIEGGAKPPPPSRPGWLPRHPQEDT